MANFDQAVEKTLRYEGGYVNDPADRGGETKYGISKRSYPGEDIASLTIERAKFLYRRDYWDALSLDRITDQAIAEELFDTAVNMGRLTASRFLQEAINLLTNENLVVDGAIGPRTLAAAGRCHPRRLLKVLNGLQFERYRQIIDKDPVQKKFFSGWMERV